MGLEYRLSKIEELQELRLEFAPRNQCRHYILKNGGVAELIEKKEFDSNYKNNEFVDGPFKDSFGDGYGESYNPNKQAFGKLKEGKVIYCELSDDFQEKVKQLLEKKLVEL